MIDIRGSVALVAGATGPVGSAVARALTARGARVAVLYRSSSRVAEALTAELGCGSMAVQADLVDPESLDAAITAIEASLGPVELLVNTAHTHLGPVAVADASRAQVQGQLDSVLAHADLCRRVVPGMRGLGRGRIVYIAGAVRSRAVPGFGAYAAAKAAATTLTRYLALEEGRHGILAGIVAPGRIVDPGDPADPSPEMAQAAAQLAARMALPDFPTSAQVAEAVLALLESDAMTGQLLWVTGGEPIWT